MSAAILNIQIEPLESLRRKIVRLERSRPDAAAAMLPFALAEIDGFLPVGGLALGALHEISGLGPDEEDGAIPAAFLAGILARLGPSRPILWCQQGSGGAGDLYGPGLAACGLKPERLILAGARHAEEMLWAMEEGLRSGALAAVVGELDELSGPASRRLQLAAESTGVTAFALRRFRSATPGPAQAQAPNAAVTRWRVSALPGLVRDGPGVGRPLWRLSLWRCRGGAPSDWIVEAANATGHVSLPSALGDGTAEFDSSRQAGGPRRFGRQPAAGERIQSGGGSPRDFAWSAAG